MSYSAKFLRKLCFCLTLLFLLCFANRGSVASNNENTTFRTTEKILNALIYLQSGEYSVKNLDLTIGEFKYLPDYETWKNKSHNGCITSFGEKRLGCFVINLFSVGICNDGEDGNGNAIGSCRDEPSGNILVQMPYFPNGKYTDIFDPSGKKVLTIDLSSKATCNENEHCDQPVEDSVNCPQDCKNNEPVVTVKSDSLTPASANQATENNQTQKKISLSPLIIGIIVLALGIFGGIGYYVYRRNKD